MPSQSPKNSAVTVRLRNSRGEHKRLQSELATFCATRGIGEDCARQLRLLLEEMFINAATHAYGEGVSGWIDVTLECRDESVFIVMEDKGVPFNPLEASTPDLSVDLGEREIGGHGLLLMRTLADDMDYDYRDRRNRLRVRCSIGRTERGLES